MWNAERQDLIPDRQYAHGKGRSTQDCLLRSINVRVAAGAISKDEAEDVVYADFESAFETMPHELLISVLPLKGVGQKIVR